MNIHKSKREEFNFDERLKPLFDRMKQGKVINEITLIDRYKKAKGNNIISNFKADDYYVAMQQNFEGNEKFDYVCGTSDNIRTFNMNWVKSFKL